MSSHRTLSSMTLLLLCLCTAAIYCYDDMQHMLLSNLYVNSLICALVLYGIVFQFYRALSIKRAFLHVERTGLQGPHQALPSLLISFAPVVSSQTILTSLMLETALDGVDHKGSRHNHVHHYLMGAVTGLGMVGTLWGVFLSISAMSSVIAHLPLTSTATNSLGFIKQLKTGLQVPLSGLSLAFIAGLFGLCGSLILSAFHLLTSRLWQSFLHKVETIVATLAQNTKVNQTLERSTSLDTAYMQSVIGQTQENIETMVRALSNQNTLHEQLSKNLGLLVEKISKLNDQRDVEKTLLLKAAEGHVEFQAQLRRFKDKIVDGDFGVDATTRNHIRHLDLTVGQLLETGEQAYKSIAQELQKELRLMTRTLAHQKSQEISQSTKVQPLPLKKKA